MYTIGIINDQNISLPETLNLRGVFFSDPKDMLLQLEKVDGVIIYQKEGQNSNTVFDLVLSIKKQRRLPIWIRDETESAINRKLNLELGAIGVLDKRISEEELVVMIKNILNLLDSRLIGNIKNSAEESLLKLNNQNHSMELPNNIEIRLTNLESKLLELLATRLNQVFTYDEIYHQVWSIEKETDEAKKKYRIANMIFHVRSKFIQQGIEPELLRTVRSVGYLLDTNVLNDTFGIGEVSVLDANGNEYQNDQL
ncbi:winged helix-turn-helix domain-containing protein [Enterococcus sp. 5H]|uniref:winged helix-turn-helix domain-containing protein n=1 Tax=Enterococcus sp. 5H TaxID=1229490 RepID=UPI002303BA39|nr:winged helix-turn-helix domain-containing protein [Enterococcus sp. 5H]MDA9470511.1 transcriptional regulator [Enterococcus sp. 5H]